MKNCNISEKEQGREDQVREHLRNLRVHKSMGPDEASLSPEGIG